MLSLGREGQLQHSSRALDAIDAFLDRQSEVGVKESEGSFTISGDRAISKLASHQLPRNTAWVLKMVQGGVVGSSSSIEVSQGPRSCVFRFRDARFGDLEDFQRAWFDPSPSLTSAQKHLMVAVRTAGFSRRRPILIAHRCPRQGLRTLFWSGDTLSSIEPVDGRMATRLKAGWPEENEFVFCVGSSPLGRDRTIEVQKGVREGIAAEYKELQRYAVCCPVPLKVDSRPLNHFGLQDISMTRKALCFSAQAPESPERPLLQLPPLATDVESLRGGAQLAWTLYYSSEPDWGTVSWVNGGVVCQEQILRAPPNRFRVRLFLPAEDLETDLTALHLRFPSLEEENRRIARGVLDFCREVGPGSPLFPEIVKSSRKQESPWVLVASLVLGGILFAPVTGGGAALLGGFTAVGVALTANRNSKVNTVAAFESFRNELERRYGEFD